LAEAWPRTDRKGPFRNEKQIILRRAEQKARRCIVVPPNNTLERETP